MSRPTSANDEAGRTNVLLEDIKKDTSALAEGQRGLREEFGSMKLALDDVDKRLQRIEPIVNTLAKDVSILKGDVNVLKGDVNVLKSDMSELKKDMKDVKERLSTVEAK